MTRRQMAEVVVCDVVAPALYIACIFVVAFNAGVDHPLTWVNAALMGSMLAVGIWSGVIWPERRS